MGEGEKVGPALWGSRPGHWERKMKASRPRKLHKGVRRWGKPRSSHGNMRRLTGWSGMFPDGKT